jgi:hypothetical protein
MALQADDEDLPPRYLGGTGHLGRKRPASGDDP